MVVNRWLADDLHVGVGDRVGMTYYVTGPGRRLLERSAEFTVRDIVPLEGAAHDPSLMPDYPGLADTEDCSDWDPGFAIDLDRLRPQDEAYWDDYHGTPKAFIAFDKGSAMWSNRFGSVTSIRFPAESFPEDELRSRLLARLDPAAVGWAVLPIREWAYKASGEAMSFSGLFLGLSMFLMGSALLLATMLCALGMEQRRREIGTLLAVGYTLPAIRGLFLREVLVLAVTSAGFGILLAMGYTRLLMRGLATVWQDAVGGVTLHFHATPESLATGAVSGLAIALMTTYLVVRRQSGRTVRAALAGPGAAAARGRAGRSALVAWVVSGVSLAGAGTAIAFGARSGANQAPAFFGAGSLLLVSGLTACNAALTTLARQASRTPFTAARLVLLNLTRCPGRSLATIALLACGAFMVIAVGSNRLDALSGAARKGSGTGGFALAAELTVPLLRDLDDAEALRQFGMDSEALAEASTVAFRVKEGDDASCLNLNRAQQPRLLGVSPAALRGRFTFAAVDAAWAEAHASSSGADDPWSLLAADFGDGPVPAVADQNSILWALGRKIGDTLEYTDEYGSTFEVVLVGGLANSILQGSVLIAERHFTAHYPSTSGYRMLLIDAPPSAAKSAQATLSRALEDHGIAIQSAADRLAEFNAVQNTYLSIFLLLGGLGLVLGSVGLGVVVLRNLLERRRELAIMRAVGYRRTVLFRMTWTEHAGLLAVGVACGAAAALLAVFPSLTAPGAEVPYATIAALMGGILVNGLVWATAAAWLGLRSPLLPALRNE